MYDTHHRVLDKEEEYELAVKMAAGCEKSLEEMVKHNIRLVYKIASKMITPVPKEELVQEGLVALVKSLRMFDPEKGYRVSIRHAIRPVGDDSIFSEATPHW